MKASFKTLILILSVSILFAGCKKRKAEKTLRGSWNVYAYEFSMYDNCTNEMRWELNNTTSYGTIDFDKKDFEFNYKIEDTDEDPSCYNFLDVKNSGQWNVTKHESQLLVWHKYTVEINDEIWYAEFRSEANTTGKARGQDDVRLFKNTSGGGEFNLLIERIE
jgi:hypothetical protein